MNIKTNQVTEQVIEITTKELMEALGAYQVSEYLRTAPDVALSTDYFSFRFKQIHRDEAENVKKYIFKEVELAKMFPSIDVTKSDYFKFVVTKLDGTTYEVPHEFLKISRQTD